MNFKQRIMNDYNGMNFQNIDTLKYILECELWQIDKSFEVEKSEFGFILVYKEIFITLFFVDDFDKFCEKLEQLIIAIKKF